MSTAEMDAGGLREYGRAKAAARARAVVIAGEESGVNADGAAKDAASTVAVAAAPSAARWVRVFAGLLSFSVPGLGHLAAGHPGRGLRWYAAALTTWLAVLCAAVNAWPRLMWLGGGAGLLLHIGAGIDGFVTGARPRALGPSSWTNAAAALIAGFVLAALPVAALAQTRARFATTLAVQTPAMYPTLEVGDRVWVTKRARDFRRGDLLVYRYPRDPNTLSVKRVIGMGGDEVQIRGDAITVNGQIIDRRTGDETCRAEGPEGAVTCSMWHETLDGRSYRVAERAPDVGNLTVQVPAGHFFVLGDNRDGSNDSRLFGTVAPAYVVGKAAFVAWSTDSAGVRWARINRSFH